MLELGANAEAIEAAREHADAFGEEDDHEVLVWAENRYIVEVFTNCRWRTQIVAGVGASMRVYEGIDAAEIKQVCDLQSVPQSEWRDVLWGVRVMEAVAGPVLNDQR